MSPFDGPLLQHTICYKIVSHYKKRMLLFLYIQYKVGINNVLSPVLPNTHYCTTIIITVDDSSSHYPLIPTFHKGYWILKALKVSRPKILESTGVWCVHVQQHVLEMQWFLQYHCLQLSSRRNVHMLAEEGPILWLVVPNYHHTKTI